MSVSAAGEDDIGEDKCQDDQTPGSWRGRRRHPSRCAVQCSNLNWTEKTLMFAGKI